MNSPYVILTHCLGVLEDWGGRVVAGRKTNRDRDTEFRARGLVADLIARTNEARAQLAIDLEHFEPYEAPRGSVNDSDASLPLGSTQGGALMHLYSELAIHRGHIEICRDLVMSGVVATVVDPAVPQPDSRYRVD